MVEPYQRKSPTKQTKVATWHWDGHPIFNKEPLRLVIWTPYNGYINQTNKTDSISTLQSASDVSTPRCWKLMAHQLPSIWHPTFSRVPNKVSPSTVLLTDFLWVFHHKVVWGKKNRGFQFENSKKGKHILSWVLNTKAGKLQKHLRADKCTFKEWYLKMGVWRGRTSDRWWVFGANG